MFLCATVPFIFKYENNFSSGFSTRWDLLFRIPEKLKTNFVSKNGVGGSSYYATLTSYEVNCRPLFSCCLTSFFVLLLSIYDSKKVSSQPLTIFMTTHFLLQHTLIYTFSPKTMTKWCLVLISQNIDSLLLLLNDIFSFLHTIHLFRWLGWINPHSAFCMSWFYHASRGSSKLIFIFPISNI